MRFKISFSLLYLTSLISLTHLVILEFTVVVERTSSFFIQLFFFCHKWSKHHGGHEGESSCGGTFEDQNRYVCVKFVIIHVSDDRLESSKIPGNNFKIVWNTACGSNT